jgi:hypothetical protein
MGLYPSWSDHRLYKLYLLKHSIYITFHGRKHSMHLTLHHYKKGTSASAPVLRPSSFS